MKKISKISTSLICLTLLVCSCAKTIEESQFNEFQITCRDGMVRSGGLYISKGINTGKTYPVIYMADGLVFKECGFKRMLDSLIEIKAISPVVVACSYENKKTVPGYRLAYRNAEYIEALAKNDNELAKLFDNHYLYFINEFIPYIESQAPVRSVPWKKVWRTLRAAPSSLATTAGSLTAWPPTFSPSRAIRRCISSRAVTPNTRRTNKNASAT